MSPKSRTNFIKYVESFGGGVGLVHLKDFEPDVTPTLLEPDEVALHDGAEFVVIIPASNFQERVRLASL